MSTPDSKGKPRKSSAASQPVDLVARAITKLQSLAPRSDAQKAKGQLEVERSNQCLLSEIRYVFKADNRSFDDLAGGFPVGRVCEVYGLEACGKTALMIRTAVKAQIGNVYEVIRTPSDTTYRKLDTSEYEVMVGYFDNEQSLDDDSKIVIDGVALNVALGRADTVDLLFKGIEGLIKVVAERQAELAEKRSKKIVFGLIVVDTIAATSSAQEMSMDWGKEDYARQPQQISRGFRKIVRMVNRNNICLICTNQVRDKIGEATNQKGRPKSPIPQSVEYTTFGGKALRFYASYRVFMYALPTKYRLVPKTQFQVGLLIGFYTVKNRIRMPLREGRMVLLFDEQQGGLNDTFSILESLLLLRFAEMENKEEGTDIRFKFSRAGIVPTTFDKTKSSTTLAEDDEKPVARRSKPKDPSIRIRADWPAFYAEHKSDFDALWAAALRYAFSSEGLSENAVVHTDDDDTGDDSGDSGENEPEPESVP